MVPVFRKAGCVMQALNRQAPASELRGNQFNRRLNRLRDGRRSTRDLA